MIERLAFVAAFAVLIAAGMYIRSMFKGEAKPNRVTWLLWAIAPLIATAAAISNGVEWSVLPVFMSGFSPLLIFIFSFIVPNAYWKLTRFDYYCGGFSVLALALWAITKEPNIAIAFAILADGLAAIPTLHKAWHYPETEAAWPFVVGFVSTLSAFPLIKFWTFSEYAFPIYLVLINILLIISVFRKRLGIAVGPL